MVLDCCRLNGRHLIRRKITGAAAAFNEYQRKAQSRGYLLNFLSLKSRCRVVGVISNGIESLWNQAQGHMRNLYDFSNGSLTYSSKNANVSLTDDCHENH